MYSWTERFIVGSVEEYNAICKTKEMNYELFPGKTILVKFKKRPKVYRISESGIELDITSEDIIIPVDANYMNKRKAENAFYSYNCRKKVYELIQETFPTGLKALKEFVLEHDLETDEIIKVLDDGLEHQEDYVQAMQLYVGDQKG